MAWLGRWLGVSLYTCTTRYVLLIKVFVGAVRDDRQRVGDAVPDVLHVEDGVPDVSRKVYKLRPSLHEIVGERRFEFFWGVHQQVTRKRRWFERLLGAGWLNFVCLVIAYMVFRVVQHDR